MRMCRKVVFRCRERRTPMSPADLLLPSVLQELAGIPDLSEGGWLAGVWISAAVVLTTPLFARSMLLNMGLPDMSGLEGVCLQRWENAVVFSWSTFRITWPRCHALKLRFGM